MPRVATQATQNVRKPDWDPDDYITIKTAPTGHALERLSSASRVYLRANEGDARAVEVVLTPHEERQAKLEEAVVDGLFRDDKGRVLAYTPDLLAQLTPEDRSWLIEQIDALWAPWLTRVQAPAGTPEEQAEQTFRGRPALGESAPGEAATGGDTAGPA